MSPSPLLSPPTVGIGPTPLTLRGGGGPSAERLRWGMSPSLLLRGGWARGMNGAPTALGPGAARGRPPSLPSLYIARVPHLWHQKRSLGPELPSPPGPRRRGAPVGSFSVMPPPPRTAGKDLASPLRGQRSRLRPAGCKMMESLRPNLPGDAGWVSCGARILALVRSGPAWDTGRWDPLSSRGRPWNGHLACFLPDANQGYD